MAKKRKKKFKIKNKKIDFGIVVLVILLAAFAVGAFIWYKSNQASREINGISAKQSEKATTIKLQDYKNEKYGFKVKYPEAWEIFDGKDIFPGINLGFSPKDINNYPTCKKYVDDLKEGDKNAEFFGRNQYCIVSVRIAKKPKNLSLKEYLKKTYDDSVMQKPIDSLEVKTINGFEAIRTNEYSFEFADHSFAGSGNLTPGISAAFEQFIIDGKDKVIFITNNVSDEMNKPDSVFNEIVSTFKFAK